MGKGTLLGQVGLKAADKAKLIPANIKSGITIDGVSGLPSVVDTADANVVASQMLSGRTGYVNGSKITGSISSKGSQTYTPGTSNQVISSGQYLSGAQTIAGDADLISANIKSGKTIFGVSGIANVVDTGDANATAAQMLSGRTGYVKGTKITGTIPSKAAQTYTPGTSNQVISSGQYLSGAQTIAGDVDLTADNIIEGKNIFGVAGTAVPSADLASFYSASISANQTKTGGPAGTSLHTVTTIPDKCIYYEFSDGQFQESDSYIIDFNTSGAGSVCGGESSSSLSSRAGTKFILRFNDGGSDIEITEIECNNNVVGSSWARDYYIHKFCLSQVGTSIVFTMFYTAAHNGRTVTTRKTFANRSIRSGGSVVASLRNYSGSTSEEAYVRLYGTTYIGVTP